MARAALLIVAGLLAASTAGLAGGQSLAEAAKREKERRAKAQAAPQPAKTYTEQDLPGLAGTVPEAAPGEATPTSAARSSTASKPASKSGAGEAYWRQRAARLRDDVKRAERRMTEAQARVDRAGPAYADPEVCQETTVGRTYGLGEEGIRKGKLCHGQGSAGEREAARQELERAQVELANARAGLEALDEDARRAGALPGWIRE